MDPACRTGRSVVTMNTEVHVTAGSYFVDKGLVSEAEGAVESDEVRAGMKLFGSTTRCEPPADVLLPEPAGYHIEGRHTTVSEREMSAS